jgi:hypothetical protein
MLTQKFTSTNSLSFRGMLVIGLFIPASIALADPMEDAVKAALNGPEKKGISLFGHGFNVKKVESISWVGGLTIITGQISHRLKRRLDDQFYYTIVKQDGGIKDIMKKIDRGGWTSIVAPILSTGAALFGVPITRDQIESIGRELGTLFDGSWESAAQILVMNIALHVADFGWPTVDEYRLDTCRWWGTDCGTPAADAFCASRGYMSSIHWVLDEDIGLRTPTRIFETGEICDQSFCDGFKVILCQG